jgi:glc operon protein GlcG
VSLTYERATECIRAIFDRARTDGGRPVAVAVVDEHGELLAFGRMEGSPVRAVTMAPNKAYTAGRLERDSDTWGKQLIDGSQEASWFGDPRYCGLPGGLAIREGDRCIGGIGVSGRTGTEDKELALFGLSKLTE